MNKQDPAQTYRQAAAVLVYFSPDQLQPVGGGDVTDALPYLAADSIFVLDAGRRPQWMLQHGVRQETLAELGSRERLTQALAANEVRPQTTMQQTLEAYIAGDAPPLAAQTREQLTCTLQVIDWLREVLPDLPDRGAVEERLAWEEWVEPLRYLVGTTFRGRVAELETLRQYVGVLPATTGAGWLPFAQGDAPPRPLLFHGMGGLGKSTLLGKLILDYVDTLPAAARFPIAYVDFDRPSALAPGGEGSYFSPATTQPLLVLIEAMRQLALQYPALAADSHNIQRAWIEAFNQTEELNTKFNYSESASQPESNVRQDIFESTVDYVEQFAALVQRAFAGADPQPFLLVLDTFEELQYRSRDAVLEVGLMLDRLQQALPTLRTVVAGRAQVGEFGTTGIELQGLDVEASIGFLLAAKVQDETVARAIAESVNGNPLSLKLAAKVVENLAEELGGPVSPAQIRTILRSVDAEQIQGFLYRRILEHIHNPKVRKIAHPGLVLRRVTWEVILEVLAEPCNLEITTRGEAETIFNELEREASLVSRDETGALVHRKDVRRLMLAALNQDEPVKVGRIHARAITYYARFDDPRSRAEEIYHRLFAESDFSAIHPRWTPGVEMHLVDALGEVPAAQRPELASRLALDAATDVDWNLATAEAWERRAAQRVGELVATGRFARALDALDERPHASYLTGSRLHLLEAQAFAGLKQWAEARVAANVGITSVQKIDDTALLLDLYLLSAHANEELGHIEQGLEMLGEATALAHTLDDALRSLEIGVRRLRLHRRQDPVDHTTVDATKAAVLAQAAALDDKTLAQAGRVLRDLVVEVGDDHPDVLARALRLLGIGGPDASQQAALAQALAAWDDALHAAGEVGLLDAEQAKQAASDPAGKVDTFVQLLGDVPGRVTARLVAWLERAPVPEPVAQALVDILQGSAAEQDLRVQL